MNGIPFEIERRPDTGVNNVMLGMWLFLASEVMLFGGLFSAYVLLRSGADQWPHGSLDLRRGMLITIAMLAASAAILMARRAATAGDSARARKYLHVTSFLAAAFLGLKTWEWTSEIQHGVHPATSTFAALYYLLTGVHAVHVLGGIGGDIYTWFARGDHARFGNRLAAVALYWYFIDIVWLLIFVLLYLV